MEKVYISPDKDILERDHIYINFIWYIVIIVPFIIVVDNLSLYLICKLNFEYVKEKTQRA